MKIGMLLDAQFVDPPEIGGGGTAVGTVNRVALIKKKLRKIGAILTSDASDDCNMSHLLPLLFCLC